eukprot:2684868-Pleurochrysis_carterae.AAC.1
MQQQRQKVHCHEAEEMSARLQREGARVSDGTLSPMWNSTRNDLDLYVFTLSEDAISYLKRLTKDGFLDVDIIAGDYISSEPVENVFLGDAEKGIEAARGNYTASITRRGCILLPSGAD